MLYDFFQVIKVSKSWLEGGFIQPAFSPESHLLERLTALPGGCLLIQ
jgi:hypothetical protein